MAAVAIEPDAGFIWDVIASGGSDLKKCMQCATCSAVCTLAPDDAPFPRRQMLAAQWGLKENLLADPAIWLCHNCGECTLNCPRGARPGDVFGAIRREAVKHYGAPRLLARAVASPRALLLLLLLPALLFAAIALWIPKSDLDPAPEFADVFPIPILEALFFAVSALALIGFAVGLARFIRALRASGAGGPILAGLAPALVEILAHRRFRTCADSKTRSLGHLLTLWGFLGLAVMGTVTGIGTMTGLMRTPLPLTSPWKIFANLCAAAILTGVGLLLVNRLKGRAASTYFDWFFLLTLFLVVLTGIGSELLRLGDRTQAMYGVYFVHLVLIFGLFLYAPYSKFAHLAYRTVAMAAARKRNSVIRPSARTPGNVDDVRESGDTHAR
jgi:quinone-modifying oxidoreductase subunit QmoC